LSGPNTTYLSSRLKLYILQGTTELYLLFVMTHFR
jgi:hypothetical protein